MDAFYASVEQRDHPELAGLPIAVGGTPQERGVVAAASYEARQFGVRSAMPSGTAMKLCPDLVFIPMRMQRYIEVSIQIREIFQRYTPLVEPLSIDEAFLDVAGSTRLFGDAAAIARQVKNDILTQLQLTASVGIAPNKFVAKIASDLKKPDGFVMVHPPLTAFLDPLPVKRLWGIGPVAEHKLNLAGIFTIQDFRLADSATLRPCVGNAAERLLKLAHGEDDRQVVPQRKSVTLSRETTFAADAEDLHDLESTLLSLVEDVATRLRNKNLSARTIGIKLRDSNFKTITRSKTLPVATNVTQVIWQCARNLLRAALGESFKIRLIGVQTSLLENQADDPQLQLESASLEQQKRIDGVMDEINQKFGAKALRRGTQ